MVDKRPFLQKIIAFDDNDFEGMHQHISRVFGSKVISSVSSGEGVAVKGHIALNGDLFLQKMEYIGDFDLQMNDDRDKRFFILTSGGAVRLQSRSGELIGTSRSAISASGKSVHATQIHDHGCLTVGFSEKTLTQRVSEILEKPVMAPLDFASVMNRDFANIDALARISAHAHEVVFSNQLLQSTLLRKSIETYVIDAILALWPNSYSDLMASSPARIAPKKVRRAIEYINTHLLERPSSERVAVECGVSLRSMQYAFREYTGYGIMEYQRMMRLSKAKEELEQSDGRTIGEIARKWGFGTSAQFGRLFRAKYGLMPTDVRT